MRTRLILVCAVALTLLSGCFLPLLPATGDRYADADSERKANATGEYEARLQRTTPPDDLARPIIVEVATGRTVYAASRVPSLRMRFNQSWESDYVLKVESSDIGMWYVERIGDTWVERWIGPSGSTSLRVPSAKPSMITITTKPT